MTNTQYLTILLTLQEKGGRELQIAEADDGRLYWLRTDRGVYCPGDGVPQADVYPLSELNPARQQAVYQELSVLPPALLEELRAGFETEEG